MMASSWGVIVLCLCLATSALCKESAKDKASKSGKGKDMMRKSIVFDKATPDVFYCPQHKPTGMDRMLVVAKPLNKLCELEGRPKPEDYKSDCYNDVDETDYACKEKKRIMKRMVKADNEEEDYIDDSIIRLV